MEPKFKVGDRVKVLVDFVPLGRRGKYREDRTINVQGKVGDIVHCDIFPQERVYVRGVHGATLWFDLEHVALYKFEMNEPEFTIDEIEKAEDIIEELL